MYAIIREIKSQNPNTIKVSRLLQLHGEDLTQGNLYNHQRWLWRKFSEGNYIGFLIILRSNHGKEFAFYIPHKFEEAKRPKSIYNHLGFYWINGDELVTVTNTNKHWFVSDGVNFIWINGLVINNILNE